jgi:hypothetical protein
MSNPISAAVGIGSSLLGASSSRRAASAQENSAQQAADVQRYMFDQTAEQQRPWREAGVNALAQMTQGTQPGGRYMSDFSMDDFQQDPGYAFRLGEGLKALDRQAAARGGLISGNALKAAGRYGQEMASQEYGNAFNRFQTQRGNQFNRLAGIAGTGQTAVNQLGNFGQQAAGNIGNSMMQAGNARASGYMGQANAIAGGLGQAANMYQQNQMMNRMFPQTPNYGVGGGWTS